MSAVPWGSVSMTTLDRLRQFGGACAVGWGLIATQSVASQPPTAPDLPLGELNFDGYREASVHSPTPPTSPVAWTVNTEEAATLIHQGITPVDVMAVRRRPASRELPAAWLLAEPHEMIPGSVWLPNVGYAELTPDLERYFVQRLAEITGDNRLHGLLFYCVADCWLSWNAAKRAAALGYRNLYWYPEGVSGWRDAGLPLVVGEPLPLLEVDNPP